MPGSGTGTPVSTSSQRYGSVGQLEARIDETGGTFSAAEETIYAAKLDTWSRAIDEFCNRFFYSTASSTRYQTAEYGDLLVLEDDWVSFTAINVDEDGDRVYERAWASTDYDKFPFNAADKSKPYTELRVAPAGRYSFPPTAKGVQLVGTIGWPAVPAQVTDVCLFEVARDLLQMKSPSGVMASAELGKFIVAPQLHPTSKMKLEPFVRHGVGGT